MATAVTSITGVAPIYHADVPGIHTEEEIDRPAAIVFLEGLVQTFVARIGRTPDLILKRLVDVVLRVGFDYEIAGLYKNNVAIWLPH